jgi:hypothetical protein
MKITDYDATTGEAIERDMTADELAHVAKVKLEQENAQIKMQQDAEAKSALLERLGITADEAALLLG